MCFATNLPWILIRKPPLRSSAYKQLSRVIITALRLEFKLFNSNLVPLARGKEKVLPVVQAGKESP